MKDEMTKTFFTWLGRFAGIAAALVAIKEILIWLLLAYLGFAVFYVIANLVIMYGDLPEDTKVVRLQQLERMALILQFRSSALVPEAIPIKAKSGRAKKRS